MLSSASSHIRMKCLRFAVAVDRSCFETKKIYAWYSVFDLVRLIWSVTSIPQCSITFIHRRDVIRPSTTSIRSFPVTFLSVWLFQLSALSIFLSQSSALISFNRSIICSVRKLFFFPPLCSPNKIWSLHSKVTRREIVLGAWLFVVDRRNSLLYNEIAGAEPTLKKTLYRL